MASDGTGMGEMAGRPDWQLIQALNQAQALLDRESRSEDEWDRLHVAVETALGQITGTTTDVSYVKGGEEGLGDRFERPTGVDGEVMERARAALMALHDRPEAEQVHHALDAVERLNQQLGR